MRPHRVHYVKTAGRVKSGPRVTYFGSKLLFLGLMENCFALGEIVCYKRRVRER